MYATSTLLCSFFWGFLFSFYARAAIDIDRAWDWDHADKSEVNFLRLADEIKATDDPDMHLQLLTQTARAQGLQQKFAQAHATLEQVLQALSSSTVTAEIRYYLERGRVFNSAGEPAKAVPLFSKAFDLASVRQDDNLTIDAAHMVGIALPDLDLQVEWDLRAIDLVAKSSNPKVRGWLVPLYYNMG